MAELDRGDLRIVSEEFASSITKAIDRNTAALLTVAALIAKHTAAVSDQKLPEFISEGILAAYFEMLPHSQS